MAGERLRELSGQLWERWDAGARLRELLPALESAHRELQGLRRRLADAEAAAASSTAPGGDALAHAAAPLADVAAVLLLSGDARGVDAALAGLRQAGAREVAVAAGGPLPLHGRQRLLELARDGIAVAAGEAAGAAAAANRAARATARPALLLIGAGERLAPGAAQAAAALLAEGQADLVALAPAEGDAPPRVAGAPVPALVRAGLAPAATLLRRSLFEQLAGLDEGHAAGTTALDLWLRAIALGARVALLEGGLRGPADGGAFFAGQPWGDRVDALAERHAALLGGGETAAALEQELARAEQAARAARAAQQRAETELQRLRAEQEPLARALRGHGLPRFDLGGLPRGTPVSACWGVERGRPIDRFYIERFLARHAGDVQGRCLEIKEPAYSRWFGGERVLACDVLDIDRGNTRATVHGDLAVGAGLPDASYDCFVLTQTLHLLYDFRGAIRHAVRVLKPGGILLATLPAVSRVLPEPGGVDTDYWRFTETSLRQLLAELLPLDAFEVTPFGNVTTAAAFLYGLAAEDLEPGELDLVDPHFPVLLGARARRP